jgi:hypothetical protein
VSQEAQYRLMRDATAVGESLAAGAVP